MSMNNLTYDGEFRYIVQWFNEWSELQREDFVPILAKYITGHNTNENYDNDELTAANGLPNDLESSGRPMSLFQCRIKLFSQWNCRWPSDFKEKLQQKISEIDSKVGEKIKLALNVNNTEYLTNGYVSNEQQTVKENTENYSTGIDATNDRITEVLNNETSVDDIETNENVNNSIEQPLLTVSNTVTAAAPLYTGINNVDNNNVTAAAVRINNTIHNNTVNDRDGEQVEQVVYMQNLQICEENAETEKEDVIETVEQKQQQPSSITVSANPVDVTQTITINAEVPLVV